MALHDLLRYSCLGRFWLDGHSAMVDEVFNITVYAWLVYCVVRPCLAISYTCMIFMPFYVLPSRTNGITNLLPLSRWSLSLLIHLTYPSNGMQPWECGPGLQAIHFWWVCIPYKISDIALLLGRAVEVSHQKRLYCQQACPDGSPQCLTCSVVYSGHSWVSFHGFGISDCKVILK